MTVAEARTRLDSIASAWRRRQTASLAVRVAALALPLTAVSLLVTSAGSARLFGALIATAAAGLTAVLLPRPPRATASLIARHLDRTRPSLEDSATLILDESDTLTTLERLQKTRVTSALATVEPDGVFPRRAWQAPAGELLAGLLAAMILIVVAGRYDRATAAGSHSPLFSIAETRSDPLAGLGIRIEPPAYTGLATRTQSTLDLEVEEGAIVTWRLPAEDDLAVDLVTGEGAVEQLRGSAEWLSLSTTASESTVYRLVARSEGEDLSRTPFAHLQVVPDDPPTLAVVVPAERLTEVAVDTDSLHVEIRAQDDYGLASADLVATLALGSGELVEFRERRIPLAVTGPATEATFRHRFDLRELGVGPAAELYFHVEARDNREPEPNVGRSPTTIVRVAGDRAASTELGAGLPVILPPTYFRSQRQIIIDTEKLLAERDDLPETELRRRSEALGGDQRALRMRYGALLGEEFVSGQAVEAGETEVEEDHEEHAPDTGEEQKVESVFDVLPEGLFHEHDSAEMATFFASETRALLKQVLGHMWEAEGRLRVVDPEGALPSEYQALELLKELQEASRVYVQKVGFEAPPLEPETRRLTGELDEIRTRHAEQAREQTPEVEAAARALLERLERPGDLDLRSAAPEARLLRQPIAGLASRERGGVAALDAIDDILDLRRPSRPAQLSLQSALWQLVPTPDPAPVPPIAAGDPLSRHYRELRSAEDGS